MDLKLCYVAFILLPYYLVNIVVYILPSLELLIFLVLPKERDDPS